MQGYSVHDENIIRRQAIAEQFVELVDSELIEIIQRSKNKYGDGASKYWLLYPLDFIRGGAAVDVLRERYGQDYVYGLMGLRKPRTVREHLNKWVFGIYPRDELSRNSQGVYRGSSMTAKIK